MFWIFHSSRLFRSALLGRIARLITRILLGSPRAFFAKGRYIRGIPRRWKTILRGPERAHPTKRLTRTPFMLDLSELRAAVRAEGHVSRRLFLAYGAALSALP